MRVGARIGDEVEEVLGGGSPGKHVWTVVLVHHCEEAGFLTGSGMTVKEL